MASSFATRDYNGGSSQSRVKSAPGAGRKRTGRDGGVGGHRLSLVEGPKMC